MLLSFECERHLFGEFFEIFDALFVIVSEGLFFESLLFFLRVFCFFMRGILFESFFLFSLSDYF